MSASPGDGGEASAMQSAQTSAFPSTSVDASSGTTTPRLASASYPPTSSPAPASPMPPSGSPAPASPAPGVRGPRPRPPRPVRCYSLEALRDDPVHFPMPTRAHPVLESMPEVSPPLLGSSDRSGAPTEVDPVGFPVPQPAPPPFDSLRSQPSSGPSSSIAPRSSALPGTLPPPIFASGLTSPVLASQPASPTDFQPLQPTRTRHRAHTVSVTMPSQIRHSRFRPLDNVREAERRASAPRASGSASEEYEGGSSINVRMGSMSDEGHGTPRRRRRANTEVIYENGELHDDAVGLLDCVDMEVSTLNHLQNVTNGIMFPNIPQLWTRRPTLVIPSTPSEHSLGDGVGGEGEEQNILPPPVTAKRKSRSRAGTLTRMFGMEAQRPSLASQADVSPPASEAGSLGKSRTEQREAKDAGGDFVPLQPIPAYNKDKLEDDESEDESEAAVEHSLDKHLRKVLVRQQRKAKLKASLKGLWVYLKTPMGVITAIYGFLVVFWGAAIVLFLLGWIPTSSKDTQDKWVEISSQVVNGLFTITGVGLIPWRAIDTYRMSVIWTLRKRFQRRCKKRGLPPLEDPDDLPDPATLPGYEDVLTEAEHDRLVDQQTKFAKSQTWYRPHATATHRAFPMSLALWNTILMDGNSFFQCLLCGCMWGMNRHTRPPWTTGSLIPLSFLCGIGAGVLIWQGGKRTKKTAAVEDKLRKALAVHEPVPERVKKPRRSTVTGTLSTGVDPVLNGEAARRPKRAATSELPHLSTGEYRLDREAILGSVAEADEPMSYEPASDSPSSLKKRELGDDDVVELRRERSRDLGRRT
ncbi:hypothetical protein CC85DRAFT_324772 [Cutaneotrichosporon oleaginosum]|uniref:Uncharacterized protein n=1 Tax=Cutaneotrichosporon oleaginosum TaxID=879819 RepID=A0A0J0XZJ9_9TREE|nr:uncharacterized protein CC85DRAFT_324772 [Cutaneotrichosporon oleaginosum]KLT46456.1 hypothetical protein CC85DRAFT_324772 [Cutaneotrichosporon oleaginosum]TXT15176.1 hypothetical protein COLE_01369 [Cutaneotrichosporon oleaginosum]